MSRTIIDRAFEMAYATPRAPRSDGLAHPFGFDQHEPHRWRVSRDVWVALVAWAGTGDPDGPSADATLLGEPIRIDDALPANSMLLEPA